MSDRNPPTDLWRWSATDMHRAVVSRQVSSREFAEACLARIDDVNPSVNALVDIRSEEALQAADAADAAVMTGISLGPLHGVPTAMKINTPQRGYATSDGVVAWADAIATEDGPTAAAWRRSGAVTIGRSNAPAFAFRWFSNNDLHGSTLNPWSAAHTPGGSSGGAAAAVAAGMLPLTQGNDIGGSVRYPAYATGITGLRTTPGRVPASNATLELDRSLAVQTMGVEGPLARTIADVRRGLAALSGRDARDPFVAHGEVRPPASEACRRIGLVRDAGVRAPDPAVDAALTDAARALENAGYTVEEIEVPALGEAYRLWYLLVLQEFATALPLVRQVGDHGMQKAAEHYLANAAEWWSDTPSLATYIGGYARRGTLIAQVRDVLERYPTLLLPVSAEQALPQDLDIAGVAEMRRCMDAQWAMMAIPLLNVPALSVPTGVANGLPLGVQLVGRSFDEERLLDVGEALERAYGALTPVEPAA